MTLPIRLRWNAVACGVLFLLLAIGAIAAATRAHSAILGLLGIAFALGVILLVVVDGYVAELIHELRVAASALLAASARVPESPELNAYLASRAERLQRVLERFEGVRASKDVRAAAPKEAIPFVPQRFHSGRATPGK
jgi:hypothetical protein